MLLSKLQSKQANAMSTPKQSCLDWACLSLQGEGDRVLSLIQAQQLVSIVDAGKAALADRMGVQQRQ